MTVEFVLNGATKITLVPSDQRDKALNRLAFDGNVVKSVDLNEDGSLVLTLAPKQS